MSATMGSEPPAFAAGNRPSNLQPAWHRAVIACVAALRCFEQSWTGCSEEKRYAGEQNKQNYCKKQMLSGRPRRGPATRQCAAQTESVATLRQSARGLAATRTGGNRWNKRENRDSASLGAGHPARGEPASDVCSICELVIRGRPGDACIRAVWFERTRCKQIVLLLSIPRQVGPGYGAGRGGAPVQEGAEHQTRPAQRQNMGRRVSQLHIAWDPAGQHIGEPSCQIGSGPEELWDTLVGPFEFCLNCRGLTGLQSSFRSNCGGLARNRITASRGWLVC